HCFRSRSDTEVIAHAWEESGVHVPEGLNGMFAFALWDRAREQLLLARDRMGEKPLYYTVVDGWLVFASELRALLAHPATAARPPGPASISRGWLATSRTTTCPTRTRSWPASPRCRRGVF